MEREREIQREAEEAERRGGKVFVGNVRKDVDKDEILETFKEHGKVLAVWVAKNPPGFAFVTYRSPEDAQNAVSQLHSRDAAFAEPNGRGLRVEISHYMSRGAKGGRSGGGPPSRRDESSRGRERGGGAPRYRSRERGGGGRRGDSRGRGRGGPPDDSRRRRR